MVTDQNEADSALIKDTWPKRRRMMNQVLAFCVLVIVYCLGWDPKYGEAAIEWSFIIIGITVLGYVFGAVLDDNAVSLFWRK